MAGEPDPRVILAAERTLLAWIRTSVAMMGFGFVVARFGWFLREMAALAGGPVVAPAPAGVSHVAGMALVLLAVAVNVLSAVWYVRFVARYRRGEPVTDGTVSLSVLLAGAIAVLGVVLVWYLLRLA